MFSESSIASCKLIHRLIIGPCIGFVFCLSPAAFADEASSVTAISGQSLNEKLSAVDRALFIELRKLAKFNIQFHLKANHHQKWRSLTYPIGRESGTAVSFAATLIDLNQQSKGLDNPARISRSELKNAVACGITGSAISGSSSALELAQNTWVMMKAKREGYSPKRSLAFVQQLVAETDSLLLMREQLTKEFVSDERREVLSLETKLVRRIRQQLLFEFGTWSCHSRDQAWRENTFYTLDALQSYTRMSAGILAMKAFGEPELARNSVICALVASSVATINPIVSNLAGVAVRKHQEKKISSQIQFERSAIFSAEFDELQRKLANDGHNVEQHEKWLQKLAALYNRSEKTDLVLDRETNEIERYRQIAQQQTISGPLIGLTGVASSTLATVAVFGYPRDIDTAVRLGFAGRITQGTGQAYALINTPYTILRGMLRNQRLRKRGELPSQLLEARLARLEKMESP